MRECEANALASRFCFGDTVSCGFDAGSYNARGAGPVADAVVAGVEAVAM